MDIGALAVDTLLDPVVLISAALTVFALLTGTVARVAEAIEVRREGRPHTTPAVVSSAVRTGPSGRDGVRR